MTIAERLHMLREERGIALEEVSKCVKVTRQTMSRYETGVITKIPYDTIVALAEYYNVHPGYLMGWCNRNGSSISQEISPLRKKLCDHINNLPEEDLPLYGKVLDIPKDRLEAIVRLLE